MKLRTADLFSGCGGFSAGLEATKAFKIDYAVDFWKPAGDIFRLNHKNVQFEALDLSETENVVKVVNTLAGNFDVLVGGPPCQGFSTLGKRRDNDRRSTLVDTFCDIAVKSQPAVVVMENVRGIASKKHPSGRTYLEAYNEQMSSPKDSKFVGYHTSHKELLATEFGLAQTRRRMFSISIRKDIPRSQTILDLIWSHIEASKTTRRFTLRDALAGLETHAPVFGRVSEVESRTANAHLAMNHSMKLKERFSHVPPGGGLLDVPSELLTPHLRKMVAGHYGSGGHVKNIYGRLKWDEPCGTIVAGMDKITCGRYLHPEADRLLTPRECARIQSFSDDFELVGGQVSRYYAVGNAVPPRLAQVIGGAISTVVGNEILSLRSEVAA